MQERGHNKSTSHNISTVTHFPQATQATAGHEYIHTKPDQPVSVPVMQSTQIATTQSATVIAKVQQLQGPASASAQPTPY